MAVTGSVWSPSSWRSFPALHQPEWPSEERAEAARARLATVPPLVFAGEARNLRAALSEVAAGRAFLLQAGDCAESFHDVSAIHIREKLKILLQMAAVLTYGATLPVTKVGRIAGQFAKARTSPSEEVGGEEIPSFRGHMIHDDAPTTAARIPDPERMVQAYYHATSTLNLLRAFTKGGFADLTRVHEWTQEFVASSPEGRRYEQLAAEIERALRFMAACGIDVVSEPKLHQVDVWTSHEGLVLDYEEALTRRDSTTGNPERIPGRLTLVARMGAEQVFELLPPLLRAVREAEHPVVWACDPMHANVFKTDSGVKTRRFDAILAEIEGFFAACRRERVWPGGVHIEFTGEDVTECLGGSEAVLEEQLSSRYMSLCDPRLNARQSLDLAFRVAELMRHPGRAADAVDA